MCIKQHTVVTFNDNSVKLRQSKGNKRHLSSRWTFNEASPPPPPPLSKRAFSSAAFRAQRFTRSPGKKSTRPSNYSRFSTGIKLAFRRPRVFSRVWPRCDFQPIKPGKRDLSRATELAQVGLVTVFWKIWFVIDHGQEIGFYRVRIRCIYVTNAIPFFFFLFFLFFWRYFWIFD